MDWNRKVVQSDYSEKMPEYPARVLSIHMLHKGLQTGSIIGVISIVPYILLRKVKMADAWRKAVPVATMIVTPVCVAVPHFMGLDVAGVDDRAFRLTKNVGQNKVDMYSTIGLGIGAATGAITGLGLLPCATTGIALGTVAYVIESEIRKPRRSPGEPSKKEKE